jgi:hypothetical protein
MPKPSLKSVILKERRRGESRNAQAKRLGIPNMTLATYERHGIPRRPQAGTKAHLAKLGVHLDPVTVMP